MTEAHPEYLPGDNLPLPSTPPQEPAGTFSPTMHTFYPLDAALPRRYWPACQPDTDLRPPQGILYAILAGGLIWIVVICLFSH